MALQVGDEILQVNRIDIDLFPSPIGDLKGIIGLRDDFGRLIPGQVENETDEQAVLPVSGGRSYKVDDAIQKLPYGIGRNHIPNIACKVEIIFFGECPVVLPGPLLNALTLTADFINY